MERSRPADEAVALSKPDPGRVKPAQPSDPSSSERFRYRTCPPRRAVPSLRIPGLDHRIPATAFLHVRHQFK